MHSLDTSNEDSSTPKRLESEHRLGDSFNSPVVLLDDIVEVFVLAHQDVYTGISLDTFVAAVLAPLLSMVIFSGKPCRLMARSKKRLAAA